jgi:hypothetical protein
MDENARSRSSARDGRIPSPLRNGISARGLSAVGQRVVLEKIANPGRLIAALKRT